MDVRSLGNEATLTIFNSPSLVTKIFFVRTSPILIDLFWNYFAPWTKLYKIWNSSASVYIFFICFRFNISEYSAKSTFSYVIYMMQLLLSTLLQPHNNPYSSNFGSEFFYIRSPRERRCTICSYYEPDHTSPSIHQRLTYPLSPVSPQ